MKISNSKKELARIISENGGWRKGSHAAQDSVIRFFTGDKPKYNKETKLWYAGNSGLRIMAIAGAKLLQNRQRTILSRAEYFHLYPAHDDDGWIEWDGGERPVDSDTLVVCEVRSGKEWRNGKAIMAGILRWYHTGSMTDIIAYRLHKQERSKSTAVGDDETNLAAKEELETLEFTTSPTLDRLMQDWRNADDYAQRKQAEADEAATMRDERWQAVQVRAGEMGVTVGRR